jgi:hypothetical protein
MKEFLSEIFIHKKHFKQIKIGYSDKKKIQDSALSLLNLKDFGQLRDRYEGDLFYKRFTKELMAEIALEKLLGVRFINWQAKSKIKDFPNKLIFQDLNIGINVIDFSEYPVLIDEEVNLPQIFCIKKGEDSIFICGLATIDILETYRKDISNVPMVLGKKVIFNGFSQLKKFETVEDLKSFLV